MVIRGIMSNVLVYMGFLLGLLAVLGTPFISELLSGHRNQTIGQSMRVAMLAPPDHDMTDTDMGTLSGIHAAVGSLEDAPPTVRLYPAVQRFAGRVLNGTLSSNGSGRLSGSRPAVGVESDNIASLNENMTTTTSGAMDTDDNTEVTAPHEETMVMVPALTDSSSMAVMTAACSQWRMRTEDCLLLLVISAGSTTGGSGVHTRIQLFERPVQSLIRPFAAPMGSVDLLHEGWWRRFDTHIQGGEVTHAAVSQNGRFVVAVIRSEEDTEDGIPASVYRLSVAARFTEGHYEWRHGVAILARKPITAVTISDEPQEQPSRCNPDADEQCQSVVEIGVVYALERDVAELRKLILSIEQVEIWHSPSSSSSSSDCIANDDTTCSRRVERQLHVSDKQWIAREGHIGVSTLMNEHLPEGLYDMEMIEQQREVYRSVNRVQLLPTSHPKLVMSVAEEIHGGFRSVMLQLTENQYVQDNHAWPVDGIVSSTLINPVHTDVSPNHEFLAVSSEPFLVSVHELSTRSPVMTSVEIMNLQPYTVFEHVAISDTGLLMVVVTNYREILVLHRPQTDVTWQVANELHVPRELDDFVIRSMHLLGYDSVVFVANSGVVVVLRAMDPELADASMFFSEFDQGQYPYLANEMFGEDMADAVIVLLVGALMLLSFVSVTQPPGQMLRRIFRRTRRPVGGPNGGVDMGAVNGPPPVHF